MKSSLVASRENGADSSAMNRSLLVLFRNPRLATPWIGGCPVVRTLVDFRAARTHRSASSAIPGERNAGGLHAHLRVKGDACAFAMPVDLFCSDVAVAIAII